MPKKPKTGPAVKPAEDPAAEGLDSVEFEEVERPLAKSEDGEGDGVPPAPSMSDPEWTAYVLSHLTDAEKANGRPRVPGLRRLVPLLLGTILENRSDPCQLPNADNGMMATVRATLKILWPADEDGRFEVRVFDGLADVYPGNMPNPKYATFPSATAETRAEGRALRKAFAIDVVTAEECQDIPASEPGSQGNGLAADHQKNGIRIKCGQLGIDTTAFVNIGRTGGQRFASLDEVPFPSADAMLFRLDEYQRGVKKIPDAVRATPASNKE